MTKEEIKNTPELVDFMLDECVLADSRAKVRKRLEEICDIAVKALEQEKCINSLPSVTPQRLRGKWIDDDCSICGYGVEVWNNTPYCPNCGAKMEVESEDNR